MSFRPARYRLSQRILLGVTVTVVVLWLLYVSRRGYVPPIQSPEEYERDRIAQMWAPVAPIPCAQGVGVTHTLPDIAKHNTKLDLWLVIRGYVLNVTIFVPHHPGGDYILTGGAKGDVTALFGQFHQPMVVGPMFERYCIGHVA